MSTKIEIVMTAGTADRPLNLGAESVQTLASEIAALAGDRDAWKAKAEAAAPTPRPAPSYKGVTYREGKWWDADGAAYTSAARCIDQNEAGRDEVFKQEALTDADHAALLALRDAAAAAPTLEEVVDQWVKENVYLTDESSRRELCTMLRTAFPQIDAPAVQAPEVSEWDREQMDAVCKLAHELGWNGVENSKLLSVFLRDYIETNVRAPELTAAERVPTLEGVIEEWAKDYAYFGEVNYTELSAQDLTSRLRAAGFDAPSERVSDADELPRPAFVSGSFNEALCQLLNAHNQDGATNTPDFVLTEFMLGVLTAFELAMQQRDSWNSSCVFIPTPQEAAR